MGVEEETGTELFYYFVESERSPGTDPVIVWLTGGPGCSGLVGNFFELGPYLVAPDAASLSRNPFAWNRLFGVLFLDSPLGTGFSAAPSPALIPRDQPVVDAHILADGAEGTSSTAWPSGMISCTPCRVCGHARRLNLLHGARRCTAVCRLLD